MDEMIVSELTDWRDFAGIPYWELESSLLTEAIIRTEVQSIIDGIGLPFKNSVPSLEGSILKFEVTTKLINQTSNLFVVRGQTLPDGTIVIYIKKQYSSSSELEVFKEELTPLLHHELTHYFQMQKSVVGIKKVVSNIRQYLALSHEIMAYANQASNMVTQSEFEEIIHKCNYDVEQPLSSIIEMFGSDELFKGGRGFIWLYFIWFKKTDPVRKQFVKYFVEYNNQQNV